MTRVSQQEREQFFPEGLEFWLAMHNPITAGMIVIAMVVKGEHALKRRILQLLRPDYMRPGRERPLFRIIADRYQEHGEIDPDWVRGQIKNIVDPDSSSLLSGYYLTWERIMGIEPTPWEIDQALSLLLWIAQKEGTLPKENQTKDQVRLIANLSPLPASGRPNNTIPDMDLEVELFEHQRVIVSDLVVLAGLLKGNDEQKQLILQSVQEDFFCFPFGGILFDAMRSSYTDHRRIDTDEVIQHVHNMTKEDKSRASILANWRIVQDLTPTNQQVEQAISLIRRAATRKGVLKTADNNK